jgi:excisionase family DNA binding protein
MRYMSTHMPEPNLSSVPPVRPARTPLTAQIERQLTQKTQLFGDPLLSIAECKLALGTSYSTVRKLIMAGKIRSWRPSPRGHHRVRLSELQKYIASGVQS